MGTPAQARPRASVPPSPTLSSPGRDARVPPPAAPTALTGTSEPASTAGANAGPPEQAKRVAVAPPGDEPALSLSPVADLREAPSDWSLARRTLVQSGWLWALGLALVAILAAIISLTLRARRPVGMNPASQSAAAGEADAGIAALRSRPPLDPQAAEPANGRAPNALPEPAAWSDGAEPPRIDVSLQIIRATRSLMMFSLDYQVTLANRSDRALRDIRISARLACAKRGVPDRTVPFDDLPPGPIARIGPHQGHSISAAAQMMLRDIQTMRQGARPLFIPLVHLKVESPGFPATMRSFVVGRPSEKGMARLHPIALDTPPGGIQGLRADEIRIERTAQPAAEPV